MSEYKCTDCGGDAIIAMSDFKDLRTGKVIIDKTERLCFKCSRIRNKDLSNPFTGKETR